MDNLKIIDFGLAQQFKNQESADPTYFTNMEGSQYYVSPQVIEGSYTAKCDLWACGVIAYMLLSGCAPFDGDSPDEIYDRIVEGNLDFAFEAWDNVSEEAMDFIQRMLTHDEEQRPTAAEALQHPWLKEHRRWRMVTADASKRNSARQSLVDLKQFSDSRHSLATTGNNHRKRRCSTKMAIQPKSKQQHKHSRLKQASCVIIAAQLLRKGERDEIDDVFRDLDTTCDGFLDRHDLKQAYEEYFGGASSDCELTEDELDIIFQQVNSSGTGKISYSEFAIAMMLQKNMLSDDKLKAVFAHFDAGRKGYITADNIKAVLGLRDNQEDYLKRKILQQVDQDGDGVITYEEFYNMMKSSDHKKKKKAPSMVMQQQCSVRRTSRRCSMGLTSSQHGAVTLEWEDDLSSFGGSHDSNNRYGGTVLINRRGSNASNGSVRVHMRRTSLLDDSVLYHVDEREEENQDPSSSKHGDLDDDEESTNGSTV